MGFYGAIKAGIKSVWKGISEILRKAPVDPVQIELDEMGKRDDIFSKARYDLMDKYGMRKDEATQTARDIASTAEADVPDDFVDTWRIMYPERG